MTSIELVKVIFPVSVSAACIPSTEGSTGRVVILHKLSSEDESGWNVDIFADAAIYGIFIRNGVETIHPNHGGRS